MAEVELDRVTSRYPDGTVALDDVSLRVADGEIMAIVGPSGSGKSTLLRVIAGLVDIERGRIVIGGNDVTHTGPQGRDVAMVFEGDALYPHLTAEGNLRFGLKIRHTPEDEIDERVKSGSKLLGLRSWLNRRPATLSAGEQQRVAVGRASVRRPSMYLLDEPLSHLDPGERFRLRREFGVYIRQMDVTTIIVTHDQEQAMAIGDRVAVMSRGRLDQVGTPTELYVAPADVTVASCLGDPPMSLLPGWFADGEDGSSLVIGRHRLTHPDLDAASGRSPGLRRRAGEPVIIGVRPEHVAPVGTGRRRGAEVELEVDTVEWRGGDQLLAFRLDDAGDPLVARAPSHVRARPGDRVRLLVDVSRLSLFDPVTGLAIWHGGLVA